MWRDVSTGNAVERAAICNALNTDFWCFYLHYYYVLLLIFQFPRFYFYKKRKEKRGSKGWIEEENVDLK